LRRVERVRQFAKFDQQSAFEAQKISKLECQRASGRSLSESDIRQDRRSVANSVAISDMAASTAALPLRGPWKGNTSSGPLAVC
jgi:hypothetical protein